jgi:general secretion pathway protein G
MNHRRRRLQRAYTLVEVLVVLAIISLMVAIVSPRYIDRLDDAREAVLRENLKVMRVAIDRFQADTGRFPKNLDELVERRYLSGVPIDPVTERQDGWVEVAAAEVEPGASGVADIRSGAEGASRKGVPYAEL